MIPSNSISRVYDPHTLSIMAIAFDRAFLVPRPQSDRSDRPDYAFKSTMLKTSDVFDASFLPPAAELTNASCLGSVPRAPSRSATCHSAKARPLRRDRCVRRWNTHFVTNRFPGGFWEDRGYSWFAGRTLRSGHCFRRSCRQRGRPPAARLKAEAHLCTASYLRPHHGAGGFRTAAQVPP